MKTNLINENPTVNKIIETLEKNFHTILDEYKKCTKPSIYFDFIFWLKSCKSKKFYLFLGLYLFYIDVQKLSGKYEWEYVDQNKFPKTFNILKPFNLSKFAFAKLGGNNRNELHVDSTPDNPMIRIHLPLIVPKGDIFLEVNGERLKWREGKCLVLDTSLPHTFWNYTGKERINLLLSLV